MIDMCWDLPLGFRRVRQPWFGSNKRVCPGLVSRGTHRSWARQSRGPSTVRANRGPDWVIVAPKSFENIPARAQVRNNTNYQRADAVEPLWRQTCMKLLRIYFTENRNMP